MAARVHVLDTDDDAGPCEDIVVLAKTHSGPCEDIVVLAKTHSGPRGFGAALAPADVQEQQQPGPRCGDMEEEVWLVGT